MGFKVDLLISLMIGMLLISRTQGAANFTLVPPGFSYVYVGETAKLVWDYSVDNRTAEFDVSSPRWMFYDRSGRAIAIAQENVFNKWKWSINNGTCPARLLNPVRVSKESTATLVIHNVTLADSGTYGCVLVLATRSPITSKVKLVVTSVPILSLNPPFSNIPINETQSMLINCSAVGTPLPNVTLLRKKEDVMSHGVGNVIINITDVTRNDSGMYNCCATNNPNRPPVCKSTLVSVQYKPEINIPQSNSTLSSYNGGKISLYCLARGVPSPLFTWYDPLDRSITTRSRNVTGGSLLELVANSPDSYGLYRCKAENILGYDEHFINVTQTEDENTTNETPIRERNLITATSKVHPSETHAHDIAVGLRTPETKRASTSGSAPEGVVSKHTMLLAAGGGTVIFILVTAIAILTVMIFKKRSKDEGADVQEQQGENEVHSISPEAGDKNMPIYAQVDFSKKKRNKQQEEISIYAEVDKTKKMRPVQVVYAELDDLYLTGVNPLPPPLPDREAYGEIDFAQNIDHAATTTANNEPMYEAIPLK